jgi:hypothetical protein
LARLTTPSDTNNPKNLRGSCLSTMASPRSASPVSDQHTLDPEKPRGDAQATKSSEKSVAADAERAISDAAKTDPSVEVQWLSGLKLWLVMMPLCFAFFLVLLDISIIATVSLRSMEPISVSLQTLTQHYRRSHKLPTSSTLSRTWAGTEQHTSSPVRLCSL